LEYNELFNGSIKQTVQYVTILA